MIEVELPDGSIAEFPDGTSDKVIQTTLRKQMVDAKAEEQLKGMSTLRKVGYGAERALDEKAMGLKQLVVGLTPQEQEELAVRRATEQKIPGAWAARGVGDMAMLGPVAGAVGTAGVARVLPQALQSVAPWTGVAALGAGDGALNPVLEGESRSGNAASGAAASVFGKALGDGLARGIDGLVAANPSIAKLPQLVRDKLTAGMAADRNTLPGRFVSGLEEKLQSVPLLGDWIRQQRHGATTTWRDNVVDEVSPKGFQATAGDSTRDRLSEVYDEFSRRYGNVLRGTEMPPSQLFESQVLKVTGDPKYGISSAQQEVIRRAIMDNYMSRFGPSKMPTGPTGTGVVTQGGQRGTALAMAGENIKDLEAFLATKARDAAKSNDPNASGLASAWGDLERAWSTSSRRALGSGPRRALRELDAQYAPYKTVERAANAVGNDFGNFTPQQLLNAVKGRSTSGQFGRGQGMLQEEAEAARNVLIDRVPNSGTVDRALGLGAVGGAVATNPLATAATLGTVIPLLTTKTGKDLLFGDTKMQAILRQLRADEALRKGGALAGTTFNDIANPESTEY